MHSVSLNSNSLLQLCGREVNEVGGGVGAGASIGLTAFHLNLLPEHAARHVLCSVEHHVFGEMADTGDVCSFISGTNLILHKNYSSRSEVHVIKYYLKAVVQSEYFRLGKYGGCCENYSSKQEELHGRDLSS